MIGRLEGGLDRGSYLTFCLPRESYREQMVYVCGIGRYDQPRGRKRPSRATASEKSWRTGFLGDVGKAVPLQEAKITPCAVQPIEKAQNGNGQLLQKVGMDLAPAPSAWRRLGLAVHLRRFDQGSLSQHQAASGLCVGTRLRRRAAFDRDWSLVQPVFGLATCCGCMTQRQPDRRPGAREDYSNGFINMDISLRLQSHGRGHAAAEVCAVRGKSRDGRPNVAFPQSLQVLCTERARAGNESWAPKRETHNHV